MQLRQASDENGDIDGSPLRALLEMTSHSSKTMSRPAGMGRR